MDSTQNQTVSKFNVSDQPSNSNYESRDVHLASAQAGRSKTASAWLLGKKALFVSDRSHFQPMAARPDPQDLKSA